MYTSDWAGVKGQTRLFGVGAFNYRASLKPVIKYRGVQLAAQQSFFSFLEVPRQL